MGVDIRIMDRNRDGYIDPMEREIGIRKEIARLNRRIDTRNCQKGYGYDDYCFRNMAARNPYMQYQQQVALSQFRRLAFFQQILNKMFNMFRAMMNEQFNRQYGQYDDGNYPYGYCPQGTESIYDRAVDPRTLIKYNPVQSPCVASAAPVPAGQVAPAIAPALVPPATATATAIAKAGNATAIATATAAVTSNSNPYDGYCQDATSDAALYLQQDIADKDSKIANLQGIYQNGDYDRADGGQEKIEAEIQKLKDERASLVEQYNNTQVPPATATATATVTPENELDAINARLAELQPKYDAQEFGADEANTIYNQIQELLTRKAEIEQNIVPADYKGDGQ